MKLCTTTGHSLYTTKVSIQETRTSGIIYFIELILKFYSSCELCSYMKLCKSDRTWQSWCMYHAFCKISLYLSNNCTAYINNICFLKHCYIFRCLYIILRKSLIIYTKVTKFIKRGNLYRRLLQKINSLKLLKVGKMCQVFVILNMLVVLGYIK